jgi:hypothetical protein
MTVIRDGKMDSVPVNCTVPAQERASGPELDVVLSAMARDYGGTTTFGVALDLEYGGFKQQLSTGALRRAGFES